MLVLQWCAVLNPYIRLCIALWFPPAANQVIARTGASGAILCRLVPTVRAWIVQEHVLDMAAFLVAAAHIGDIPEYVPQNFEIKMCQDQQIRHQGERGVNPEAERKKHRSHRWLTHQVDEACDPHQGNDDHQISEPEFMVGVELLPIGKGMPARTFQEAPEVLDPLDIFPAETETVAEGSFKVVAVEYEVQQRCREKQYTTGGVQYPEPEILPVGNDFLIVEHEDARCRQRENQHSGKRVNEFFHTPEAQHEFLGRFTDLGACAHTGITPSAFLVYDVFQGHGGPLILGKYEPFFFPDHRAGIDAVAAGQTPLVPGNGLIHKDPVVGLYALGEQAHSRHRAVVSIQYPFQVSGLKK